MRPLPKTFLALALFVASHAGSFAQLTFSDPTFVRDSWGSHEMKAGDFDGNSLTDFAYVSGDRHLYVYWQQEDQSFDSTSIFLGDGSAVIMSMAAGDLNQDGLTDLVVYDNGITTDQVVVFISAGTGFSKSVLQTPGYIISKGPEIADINNDGHSDIVVANDSNPFIVFQGSATGAFERTEIPSSSPIHTFAVNDLNGDNLNDIVGLNYTNEVVIFMASSGGFTELKSLLPEFVEDLLVEDFSGDDVPDVIVGLSTTHELTYWENNGDGTFNSTVLTGLPPIHRGLAAIDYDKDGFNDIFAVGEEPFSAIVLRNDGSGFTPVVSAINTLFASSIIGFENGMNEPAEIFVANAARKVDIYTFDGTFSEPRSFLLGTSPTRAKVADMNQDGFQDFIVASDIDCAVTVLYGDDQNSYTTRKTFILKALAGLIAIADFNGDSYPDLAYSTRGALPDSHTAIIYSDSEGNLHDAGEVVSTISNSVLLAGDVNHDEWPDLVIDNIVLLGSAQGLSTETVYTQGMTVYSSALGDLNNDHYDDLVLAGSGTLKIFFNDGAGNFPASLDISTTRANIELELTDVNGDNYLDIAIGHFQTGEPLTLFINDQNENFDHQEIAIVGAETLKPTLADLNGDGRKDILGTHQTTVDIFLQDEDGDFFFHESTDLYDNTHARSIESADMNGDEYPDLVAFSSSGHPITILFNEMVLPPANPTGSVIVSSITSATAEVTLQSGGGTGRLVLVREAEAVNVAPVDNTFYQGNPGMGDGLGENTYVVFAGAALNFNLENLKKNTTYHLAAFEFNHDSKSTYINYHPTATTVSFKTKDTQTINGAIPDMTFAPDGTGMKWRIVSSSNLPVEIEKISGDLVIEGDTITITGPGPVELLATQEGNNQFDPAPEIIVTFCVNPVVPVITKETETDPYGITLVSSSEVNNQWSFNGAEIENAVGQTYVVEENGVFTVTVDYGGCSNISAQTEFLVVGTAETFSSRLSCYPNPVKDQLIIKSSDHLHTVQITDGIGRTFISLDLNRSKNTTIDVSALPSGLYTLSLETERGIIKKKITKKGL